MNVGRASRLRVVLALVPLSLCAFSAPSAARTRPHPPPAVVSVTDDSPDASCCAVDNGDNSDPGGQMDGIAADPLNPNVAYVSGEQSGVWRTTDGGASWVHMSVGLTTGETNGGGETMAEPALSVDPTRRGRLLFAAVDDDLAPGYASTGFGRTAGLYGSLDAARSWFRMTLPGCPAPSVSGVAFAGGAAYAATACGVAVSTDPTLKSWAIVHPDGNAGENEDIWAIAAQAKSVWACDNGTANVYRSVDEGQSWTPFTVPGASNCWSLAAVPDTSSQFAMVDQTPAGIFRVLIVDTLTGAVDEPAALPQPGNDPTGRTTPSGRPFVHTAAIPGQASSSGAGIGYTVLASNGDHLYELGSSSPQSWSQVAVQHFDVHGVALAAGYDPAHGHCTAYISDDGGAFRATAAHSRCQISSDTVRLASHGLHGFGSWGLGLVQRARCPSHVKAPCPGVYLAANDNGVWGSAVGGHGTNVWRDMDCGCGDGGLVFTDWRLPTRIVMTRGSTWTLRVSHNGTPPDGSASESVSNIGVLGLGIGSEVQTMPGQRPAPRGVYYAIQTLPVGDRVLRNSSGLKRGWRQVGPTIEPTASVTEIEVADGGKSIFVLQGARGKVLTLGRDAAGRLAWINRSVGLRFADNFVVDPFDGQILYATDLGDPSSLSDDQLMSSTNGGRSWHLDSALTNLAHARGRFRMACGDGLGDQARVHGTANGASFGFRYQCTLESAAFDPTHPTWRFVVLDPAGVFFSRDRGSTWVRLPGTSSIDRPTQSFFDPTPNPATGDGSLYIALHGHGLIRLDAPWPRIAIPTGTPLAPPPPPKPPPPPPPTGATAISLDCPASVFFPGTTITGSLAPPLPDAVIHIDILAPPSIGTRELTATTDVAGAYSFLFSGPVGRYTLTASYAGDVDHAGSSSDVCAVPIFPPPG
jgi:hypothetical protein